MWAQEPAAPCSRALWCKSRPHLHRSRWLSQADACSRLQSLLLMLCSSCLWFPPPSWEAPLQPNFSMASAPERLVLKALRKRDVNMWALSQNSGSMTTLAPSPRSVVDSSALVHRALLYMLLSSCNALFPLMHTLIHTHLSIFIILKSFYISLEDWILFLKHLQVYFWSIPIIWQKREFDAKLYFSCSPDTAASPTEIVLSNLIFLKWIWYSWKSLDW